MRIAQWDAALATVREIPGHRSMSLLELGCGDANVLQALLRDGMTVRGTTYHKREEDYVRNREYPPGLNVDIGVDLNRPLPYPDATFDVVLSTEVIEHVEGHRNFVTEACRVLKPGGYLVMTSPNVHRLMSRLHFFLGGVHLVKHELLPPTEPLAKMEEFHHRPVDFPLLHWLLWRCGLRIETVRETEVHMVSRLALLLWPLVWLTTRMAVFRHRRDAEAGDAARRDLHRWMMAPAMLTSEQFCIRARKVAEADPFRSVGC